MGICVTSNATPRRRRHTVQMSLVQVRHQCFPGACGQALRVDVHMWSGEGYSAAPLSGRRHDCLDADRDGACHTGARPHPQAMPEDWFNFTCQSSPCTIDCHGLAGDEGCALLRPPRLDLACMLARIVRGTEAEMQPRSKRALTMINQSCEEAPARDTSMARY